MPNLKQPGSVGLGRFSRSALLNEKDFEPSWEGWKGVENGEVDAERISNKYH
jgi:hypothetical protein